MNQILTDEEIFKLQYELQYRDGGFQPIPFARAIEQAILNKLSEQKPSVPDVNYFDAQRMSEEYGIDYNKFCAAHNAMLAAARSE